MNKGSRFVLALGERPLESKKGHRASHCSRETAASVQLLKAVTCCPLALRALRLPSWREEQGAHPL